MSFAPRSQTIRKRDWERMISATLSKALAAIERRARVSAALRVLVPVASVSAFSWIVLRIGVTASLLPASILVPAALGLIVGTVLLVVGRGCLVRVPPHA